MLIDEEKSFFLEFQKLPTEAQCLYVRLVSCKGPYFRSDKLQFKDSEKLHYRYPEIPHLPQMLEILAQADLVAINPNIDAEILLDFLLRDELLQLDPKGAERAIFS